MARRATRPLNDQARQEADYRLHAAHQADPRPNALFTADGSRRALDPSAPDQAALRGEWLDLYEAAGGAVEEVPDDNGPVDAVIHECPLGHLLVRVRTPEGTPVPEVLVTVPACGAPRSTNGQGIADFGRVEAGHYSAEGRKDWHLPAPANGSTDVPEREQRTIDLTLDPVQFHLHLDADRNGIVDDDRTGLDRWTWGRAGKGAILLCNNDDDGHRNDLDHADDRVNGGNDRLELAPVAIRRTGQTVPPDAWTVEISVTAQDASLVRLFETMAAGASEVLGPSRGATYRLPDLAFQERVMGMEAVRYAGDGFAGLVALTLTVSNGAGASYQERGVLRVAPWIMPSHLDAAERVYVIDAAADNQRFRNDLARLVSAAGCQLTQHPVPGPDNDIWMQDCMELGFSNLPGHGIRAVMHPPRGRGLEGFPRSLLGADLGYYPPSNTSGGSTFDANGNLEVTPAPVTSQAGKRYPFGRIYYGGVGRYREQFDAQVAAFLAGQIVQRPIPIDTSWLAVGHVDEIISFVPAPRAPGFKLLLASPGRALQILRDNRGRHGRSRLLTGRHFPRYDIHGARSGWDNAEVTVADFLDNGLTHLDPTLDAAEVVRVNDEVQARMDRIRDQFAREIGVDPAQDVVQVPILYFPSTALGPALLDALTAGMVNMLVINNHCIVPKPFGPVARGQDLFEQDLGNQLRGLGLTIQFIDDWYEYHINLGEVHCGTNTLRTPTRVSWWEFEP